MIVQSPLRVGIVGTGFAAQRRAEALQADGRSQLCYVTGNTPEHTDRFCQTFNISALPSWQALVDHSGLDLVVIATINRDHATIAQAALEAGKHVIVEYPLALDYASALALLALAEVQNKLLHVEHIELLGGVHQALRRYLPDVGEVFAARYVTVMPQAPAPRRWTYHYADFGFPLVAALSRINRFTDLLGEVISVNSQARFWPASDPAFFRSCLCQAQLQFRSGLWAEVVYGKGEVFHSGDRLFTIDGDRGSLRFDGETGVLIQSGENQPLEVGSRRGLFAQDTANVLDHLLTGTALYVHARESVAALKVADAARHSVKTGQPVSLESFDG